MSWLEHVEPEEPYILILDTVGRMLALCRT